ncbi:MAG: transglutaminase family protein [Acholeplasmatales bacterium]|nr:transglutaminase family protein [Acholeplasmatales bacterium]
MNKYLEETPLLDFHNKKIEELVQTKKWMELEELDRIKEIYNYIRDDILFGYNVDDKIKASKVLKDGFGQCNTKGILFMALLRSCNIPCRIHGFTIDKKLQEGAMTGFVYKKAPKNILHSWVEVYYDNNWFELEGFILDKPYLTHLQNKFIEVNGTFMGYGVAVKDFKNPVIDFNKNNTYIQSEGINQDFGIYDNPDLLFNSYKQELSRFKRFLFRHYGRHKMNKNVKKVRSH